MEKEIPRIEDTREFKNIIIEYVIGGVNKVVEVESNSIWQLEFPVAYNKDSEKFFESMFTVLNGELSEEFVNDFLMSPVHAVDLKRIRIYFNDGDVVEFKPSKDECLLDISFGFTYVNNFEVVAITYGGINPHYIYKRFKRDIEDFYREAKEPEPISDSEITVEDLFK